MSTQAKLLILFPVFIAVAALGGYSAYWLITADSGEPQVSAATVLKNPRPLPQFSLVDQDGQPVTEADFTDRWSLLFFGFTHCPDICPDTLGRLHAVEQSLASADARRLQIVFVSLDPKRDTPEQLSTYLEYFDPDFVGLTGRLEELDKLTQALYLPFSYRGDTESGDYSVDHSGALVLISPQGQVAAYFSPPHDVDVLAADLGFLINASRQLALHRTTGHRP